MFIKKVKIENFKRFDLLEVDLKRLDCIVGANNCGKTTLLQALALFDFCIHHCLAKKDDEQIGPRSRTIGPEEFYVLPIASPMDLWTDRKTIAKNKHKIIRVSVTFDDDRQVTAAVDLNFNRFGISVEMSTELQADQAWLKKLRSFRVSYLPVFSTFLPQEERKTPAVIEDAMARGRVNSVIRNLLLDVKKANRQNELTEILRRAFPQLTEIQIEFDESNDRFISFLYKEENRPKEFDVFNAGSGFQQFVYLFGFILLRQPTVILLDEPDVHLHGSLQRALLNELRRLSESERQVLFATHSHDLVAQMAPENLLSLEAGVPNRLSLAYDVFDVLDRLGSMENSQVVITQAYRRVLVVEDQSDWDILSICCSTILGAAVWQQIERRLARCFSRGNPWKQGSMPRLREQLQQMISTSGAPLEMFVIADRDYAPDMSVLLASLPQNNIEWHVWERVEIENYLLSESCFHRILGGLPIVSTLFDSQIDALMEASRDVANDRLVKAFEEHSRRNRLGFDSSAFSRSAREYLQAHWGEDRILLCDAKDIVLPGIKRWLQNNFGVHLSDKSIAQALAPDELPQEFHELAHQLAVFSGIRVLPVQTTSNKSENAN